MFHSMENPPPPAQSSHSPIFIDRFNRDESMHMNRRSTDTLSTNDTLFSSGCSTSRRCFPSQTSDNDDSRLLKSESTFLPPPPLNTINDQTRSNSVATQCPDEIDDDATSASAMPNRIRFTPSSVHSSVSFDPVRPKSAASTRCCPTCGSTTFAFDPHLSNFNHCSTSRLAETRPSSSSSQPSNDHSQMIDLRRQLASQYAAWQPSHRLFQLHSRAIQLLLDEVQTLKAHLGNDNKLDLQRSSTVPSESPSDDVVDTESQQMPSATHHDHDAKSRGYFEGTTLPKILSTTVTDGTLTDFSESGNLRDHPSTSHCNSTNNDRVFLDESCINTEAVIRNAQLIGTHTKPHIGPVESSGDVEHLSSDLDLVDTLDKLSSKEIVQEIVASSNCQEHSILHSLSTSSNKYTSRQLNNYTTSCSLNFSTKDSCSFRHAATSNSSNNLAISSQSPERQMDR